MHPRVTTSKDNKHSKPKDFKTFEDAVKALRDNGYSDFEDATIHHSAEHRIATSTTTNTASPRGKYWAVAGCETIEIFNQWEYVLHPPTTYSHRGVLDNKKLMQVLCRGGAEKATKGTTACYKAFEIEWEAEEFIAIWKDAVADVWRREIRKALDEGWRPQDMEFNIKAIMMMDKGSHVEGLERLRIRDESYAETPG